MINLNLETVNIKPITLEERIEFIVNTSYCILCNKIANGDIEIPNEASMQLHLGTIMKQLGMLFEYSPKEHFRIEMEAIEDILPTQKSSKGKARCDIKLTLSEGKKSCKAFVELKYLKKSANAAVTDNKFFVYCDIENLERYKSKEKNSLCYEIIYTDNLNYTSNNDTQFCVGDGNLLTAGTYPYTKNRKVQIANNYQFKWDIFNKDACFMKLKV